jgi:hypothetical protein
MKLPEDYVVLKFYELGYRPMFNKFNHVYQCGCPVCGEGGSRGQKRRCYYVPKNDNIYCHNCGWSSKPFKWIKTVSGVDDSVIINELKEYTPGVDTILDENNHKVVINTESLPADSINLSDKSQLEYYKSNDVVRATINLVKLRRLDTAINRPDNLYLSLTDRVHKNRLVIPFVNENHQIEHYQTRTVLSRDNKTKPKFLSKSGGAQKPLFNVDKVTNDYDTIYVFEGPMDAFFVKNSVAVAGITEKGRSFTDRQKQQLDGPLKFYVAVWILDSQWVDRASLIKTEALLQQGEKVFIWPEKFGKRFKDFNDIAMTCKIDEISHDFCKKNTFEGLEGIVRLSEIKKYQNN